MNTTVHQFFGKEVSCRTFQRLLAGWETTGRPLDALVTNTGCSLDQLRNKHERISWDAYRAIIANTRTVWEDDDYYKLGLVVMDTPWALPFTIPGRLLYSAKDIYRMMVRPGGGIARRMFTCIEFIQHEVGPQHLIVEMAMKEGYAPCPEYFLISRGTLTTLPNLVGLGNAQVEMKDVEGGVRFDIQLPEGGGVLAGVRRALTTPVTARAAARELEEAYSLLYTRNSALEEEVFQRRLVEEEREQLIKDLEAKNEELERKNAELERFVYTVSHDLKSPIVTINGFLGLLKQAVTQGDSEAIQKDIAQINAATNRMGRLLNELLELSRVGRLVNESEAVALDDLTREVLEILTGPIGEKGVTVEIEAGMPTVLVDRVRLLEVYQNLIENAVKFMGDQPTPRVKVGAHRHDGEAHCYVQDNGIGIDPKYHERVFRLFERLDPKIDGTGIGLTLSKRIVETLKGRMWIESDGIACGATFWFTLPLVETG